MQPAEINTEAVFTCFVGPMRRWFNDPPGADGGGFFADLADDLRPYTPHQLGLAAASLRRSRAVRSFPTIRECIDACEKMPAVPAEQVRPVPGKKTYRERELDRQDEWRRLKEAERLCRSDLGILADREMWLTALIEFAAEHQRLPDRYELPAVKALAMRSNERVHELWQAVERAKTTEARNDAVSLAQRMENLRLRMHESARRAVFPGASSETRSKEAAE